MTDLKNQAIGVNVIKDTQAIECEKCHNQTFVPLLLLRKISAIMSPSGQAGIIPVQVFGCNACGNINKEFLPTGEVEPIKDAVSTQESSTKPGIRLL